MKKLKDVFYEILYIILLYGLAFFLGKCIIESNGNLTIKEPIIFMLLLTIGIFFKNKK